MATRPAARPGGREQVAEIHAKAFAEIRKADTTPRWRSIGPDTIAGVNGSNASGNVIAIAVDPSNPTHLLVAGSAGGIWESRDAGASWAPRGDDEATTSIGALVFHPTDSNVAYCATGDGQGMDYLGVGLLRSMNGGRSWTTLCTAPFVGHGFFDLKVLPGGHLFAASGKGLYVSGDGGVTWVQQRGKKTWSLAVASGPGRPQVLAGCEDGVFESTDLGVHWTQVHLPFAAEILRVAVAISPSDPSVAYAWAAYAEASDRRPRGAPALQARARPVDASAGVQLPEVAGGPQLGARRVADAAGPRLLRCHPPLAWRDRRREQMDAADVRRRDVPHSSRFPRARVRPPQLRHRLRRLRRRRLFAHAMPASAGSTSTTAS